MNNARWKNDYKENCITKFHESKRKLTEINVNGKEMCKRKLEAFR